MLAFLRYLDARFGEASTYAAIAAMLTAAHVSVDPGLLHAVTLWGVMVSGAAAILLREWGAKPAGAIAGDVLDALLSGIRMMPPASPPAPVVTAPVVTPAPVAPVTTPPAT